MYILTGRNPPLILEVREPLRNFQDFKKWDDMVKFILSKVFLERFTAPLHMRVLVFLSYKLRV